MIQVRAGKPHERGLIVGLQPERPLERRDGFQRLASSFVTVAEVVRPANVIRRQHLRVDEAGFGLVGVFGRHEQHAHMSISLGELGRGRARLADAFGQRAVRVAQLAPHGLGRAR